MSFIDGINAAQRQLDHDAAIAEQQRQRAEAYGIQRDKVRRAAGRMIEVLGLAGIGYDHLVRVTTRHGRARRSTGKYKYEGSTVDGDYWCRSLDRSVYCGAWKDVLLFGTPEDPGMACLSLPDPGSPPPFEVITDAAHFSVLPDHGIVTPAHGFVGIAEMGGLLQRLAAVRGLDRDLFRGL